MTTIVAQIRAIRIGHSERAQVHAVCAKGHDIKIEVASDEVPGAVGDLLVLSWSAHVNPAAATPALTAPSAPVSVPVPASMSTAHAAVVDGQFDALMRGGAPQTLTPDQQLAALFKEKAR